MRIGTAFVASLALLAFTFAGTGYAESTTQVRTFGEVLLEEDFDDALSDEWNMSSSGSIVEYPERGGVLVIDAPKSAGKGRKQWAHIYIPVEPGHYYRASVDVRTENAGGRSGAILYGQLADPDKGYVRGGSFFDGVKRTRGWRRHETNVIPPAYPIPEGVGYVHLLVGIDGWGKAWFDNLVFEKLDELPRAELIAPADGAEVNTRRPKLRFESFVSQRAKDYRVEWSRSDAFPADETFSRAIYETMSTRPLEPLASGRWYWRVWDELHHLPSHVGSFTVTEDAEPGSLVIDLRWTWSDEPRPSLEAFIGPAELNPKITATIGGVPATVVHSKGGVVHLRPQIPLHKGIHNVQIHVEADGQTASMEQLFNNQTPGSKVHLDEHGRLVVNGRPTFVVGAYRDPSDTLTDFSGLKEAGFNMTHSYDFRSPARNLNDARAEQYLRDAEDAGLMVFLGFNTRWMERGTDAAIAQRAARLMDEPALTLWYISDEPEWRRHFDPANRLREIVEITKRMDPHRPTSLVNTKSWSSAHWGKVVDIAWVDPYPIGRHPLDYVYDVVQGAVDLHDPDKTVWAVLGAFDWKVNDRKEAGKPLDRPDEGESRCMTHLALAGGAQGIVWYWLPSQRTGHMPTEMPVVWEGLKTVVPETRELEPWLLSVPSEADRIDLPAPLRGWSRQHDGERVLGVANPTEEGIWLDAADTNRPDWLHNASVRHGTSEQEPGRWYVPARDAVVWDVAAE